MPKLPPRSLCLPDIVADPQTRADYIEANPPQYGPSCSRPPSISDASSSPISASPISTNSQRASAATLFSLASPSASASTRTSLSVHNLSWSGDSNNTNRTSGASGTMPKPSEPQKTWSLSGLIEAATSDKSRSSWSDTLVGTKSWFRKSVASTPSEADASLKPSNQKEIKLSPSMLAAVSAAEDLTPKLDRPMSFPLATNTQRRPRVGTGLRYYTERNPAPPNIRAQISEPGDTVEHPTSPHPLPVPTTPLTTSDGTSIPSPNTVRDERPSSPNDISTRSPITTIDGDNTLPDIRVSSG